MARTAIIDERIEDILMFLNLNGPTIMADIADAMNLTRAQCEYAVRRNSEFVRVGWNKELCRGAGVRFVWHQGTKRVRPAANRDSNKGFTWDTLKGLTMPAKDAAKPTKKRKHTLSQLADRPLTIPTCEGEVTVTAETKNGQLLVAVLSPNGLDVRQAGAQAKTV